MQSRTFDLKADAEKWARDIERDMDRGSFVSRKEAELNRPGFAGGLFDQIYAATGISSSMA